jgi:ribosomal protein L13
MNARRICWLMIITLMTKIITSLIHLKDLTSFSRKHLKKLMVFEGDQNKYLIHLKDVTSFGRKRLKKLMVFEGDQNK